MALLPGGLFYKDTEENILKILMTALAIDGTIGQKLSGLAIRAKDKGNTDSTNLFSLAFLCTAPSRVSYLHDLFTCICTLRISTPSITLSAGNPAVAGPFTSGNILVSSGNNIRAQKADLV